MSCWDSSDTTLSVPSLVKSRGGVDPAGAWPEAERVLRRSSRAVGGRRSCQSRTEKQGEEMKQTINTTCTEMDFGSRTVSYQTS